MTREVVAFIVDKERMEGDPRLDAFGMPKADNANYLWIHFFYSALSDEGKAGFVMANSASDARGSELEVRKKLIKAGVVNVMVAIGSNFFYTVTLPYTLWFLDKGKADTTWKNKVLFIDARQTYKQIDRAHREFSDEQIEFLADIVRLYRGEAVENAFGSQGRVQEKFPDDEYLDVQDYARLPPLRRLRNRGGV